MTKKWTLSDSGLQVYEGKKHIATVHYGGNPIVDITEAIENATLIRQAPAMEAELAALRAERDELLEALRKIMSCANVRIDDPRIDIFDHARAVLAKYEAK